MRAAILFPALLAALAFGALIGAWRGEAPLDGLAEDLSVAARAALFGADAPDPRVVVVALDERSLDSDRLSGLPRALMSPVWAEIADKALGAGATAVGFDLIMAFDAGALVVGDKKPLSRYDNPFLTLLRREGRAGRVVIGRTQKLAPGRRYAMLAGAKGLAFVDVALDQAGVARRVRRQFETTGGGGATTMAGALLTAAGDDGAGPIAVTPRAPLTALPTISVIDLLNCDDDAALARALAGKVVLVGGDMPGEDRFRTPDRFMNRPARAAPARACDLAQPLGAAEKRSSLIPGVYLHAGAVDGALSGWAPTLAPRWATGALAAGAALAATAAALFLAPSAAAAATIALMALSILVGAAALEAGWLIAAARPAYAALLAFAFGWAGKILFLDRRARRLRAGFGRYVSPALVDRLVRQDRLPELDGEQRLITVMFADLSGFTALSEKVDGKTLTRVVNKYLELITTEVEASGGYVDKYIGDAVMALWNAPADLESHARDAALAACRINAVVNAAAKRDRADGLPAFAIKIGVNTGQAIVGNVGAARRLNYTAVGDAVNIAARMEGLPSVLMTPVILGPTPAQAAADRFAMLEIGSIRVKGRAEPVALFAPLAPADARPDALYDRYADALAAYKRADFDAAATGWSALAQEDWEGAGLSGAMSGFARDAAAVAPHDDWTGVIVMTTK